VAAKSESWAVLLQVAHTADLDTEALVAARDLLDFVFADEMTEEDWNHSLGGMHVVARYDELVIGHAAVVQRRIMHAGVPLRAGYVEGVAVHPEWQRRGIGGKMMDQIEQIIGTAYELGALGASDDAIDFYEHRGWIKWLGPTAVLSPEGIVRTTEEDGFVYVLPARDGRHPLDIRGDLVCDWRDGDVW
jgi:aminoglycoside 2'-N-acetyltransferase I